MEDWADWLVTHGQADAAAVAEAERVLEAAALQPGDTVLDVGAGLGLLTLAAHERIGDGWVIAVDPSVGALEELLRLAHVGEVGVAVDELARVLRRGGRLSLCEPSIADGSQHLDALVAHLEGSGFTAIDRSLLDSGTLFLSARRP